MTDTRPGDARLDYRSTDYNELRAEISDDFMGETGDLVREHALAVMELRALRPTGGGETRPDADTKLHRAILREFHLGANDRAHLNTAESLLADVFAETASLRARLGVPATPSVRECEHGVFPTGRCNNCAAVPATPPDSGLRQFINESEGKWFRTASDTGANSNALFVWNRLRVWAGMPELTIEDLEARYPEGAEYAQYTRWWYGHHSVPQPDYSEAALAAWRAAVRPVPPTDTGLCAIKSMPHEDLLHTGRCSWCDEPLVPPTDTKES